MRSFFSKACATLRCPATHSTRSRRRSRIQSNPLKKTGQTKAMPGRSRSNSFKVCAALLAGGAKALVAPQQPRVSKTTVRAAMSDPEESPEACRARALTEEFSETKTSDDAVFAELWERVSKSRSDAVRQDRLTASNWRRGAHDRLSLIHI